MFALVNCKVVALDFEYDGVAVQSGTEIVISDREADKLVKNRQVVIGRFLDPADEKDQKAIAEAEAKYKDKYEVAMEKEDARDEAKEDELKEDDEERKTLIEEAQELMTDIAALDGNEPDQEEMQQITRLETPVIKAAVEKLRAEKDKLEGGEDTDNSEETADDVDATGRPEVSDKMKREDLEAIAREEGVKDVEIEDAKNKQDLVDLIKANRT